ncbi:hypothetical protein REMIM1_PE00543 (plasmid) [Rhizobium etli bv. mimosae str. Mim1]|nr:hypothetical protein REMIM1_PE00543 [Rhizobium etli bv. mimosae str. Mim1]
MVAQAAAICLTASLHQVPDIVLIRSRLAGRWGQNAGTIESALDSSIVIADVQLERRD